MTDKTLQKNIPIGWRSVTLGDVSDIQMGQSPSSAYYNQDAMGLPFFQGKADFTDDLHVRIRQWTSHVTKTSNAGDILMSVRAPVGDIALNNTQACIGRGLASIRAKDDLSTQKFLFQVLQCLKPDLNKMAQGSTFTAINGPALKKIPFNLPPLPDQKRIAEVLSSVDEEIQKVDSIISETEKLKNGLMQDLFTKGIGHTKFKKTKIGMIPEGWEISELDKYIRLQGGNAFRSSNYVDRGVSLVRIGNVGNGYFINKNFVYISTEEFERNKAFHLNAEDILMGMTGELGKVARIPEKDLPAALNQRVGRVCFLNDQLDQEFIYQLFLSDSFISRLDKLFVGAAQKNISSAQVERTVFAVPSLVEQKKIGIILSSVDKKISVSQELKAKLTELKKGLMSDLLSGNKRVKI